MSGEIEVLLADDTKLPTLNCNSAPAVWVPSNETIKSNVSFPLTTYPLLLKVM